MPKDIYDFDEQQSIPGDGKKYCGFRFRTKEELNKILEDNKGKAIYETPEEFVGVIPGIKIFDVWDIKGSRTGEQEIFIECE